MNKTEYITFLRSSLQKDPVGTIDMYSKGRSLNINEENDAELLEQILTGQNKATLRFIDQDTAYQAVAMALNAKAPDLADFFETEHENIYLVKLDLSAYQPVIGRGFALAKGRIHTITTAQVGVILTQDNSMVGFQIISAFPIPACTCAGKTQDLTYLFEQTDFDGYPSSPLWYIAARAICNDPMLQDFDISWHPNDDRPERLVISHRQTPASFHNDIVTLFFDDDGHLQKTFETCDLGTVICENKKVMAVSKTHRSIGATMMRNPELVQFTMQVIDMIENIEPKQSRPKQMPMQPEIQPAPTPEPSQPAPRYSEMSDKPVKELADHDLFPAQNYSSETDAPVDYTSVPKPKSTRTEKRGPVRPAQKPFGLKDIT